MLIKAYFRTIILTFKSYFFGKKCDFPLQQFWLYIFILAIETNFFCKAKQQADIQI